MNVTGLITEFNPFHNGHKYYIEKAKEATNADYLIAVMSGNFTQRGEPALIDKYSRTKMALSCGVDLVLELPVCHATGSAEYFATGAVDLLSRLATVNSFCFGSESGNLDLMTSIAKVLLEEPVEFQESLKQRLKAGNNFPSARAHALSEYLRNQNPGDAGQQAMAEACLQSPNNILGIEYIKAHLRLGSSMTPVTMARLQNSYHDRVLSSGTYKNHHISSATSIRQILTEAFHSSSEFPDALQNHLPKNSCEILRQAYRKNSPVESNDFSLPLHYCLLLVKSPEELVRYQDISPDLANRIYHLIPEFHDFDSFVTLLKTRQFTETRIRRALLHILLKIPKMTVSSSETANLNHYIRVLGFRSDAVPLLSKIKKRSSLPLITKLADSSSLLDAEAGSMLASDIFNSAVYHSVVSNQFSLPPYNEYTRQLVIL